MTLDYIAAIIESAYYNGRVTANDKKMDEDDFMQIARACNGDVMRAIWYEENQVGNPNLYFFGSVTTERYKVEKRGRFRVVNFDDGGVVKLPYAMGILRVTPAMQEEDGDCDDFDGADSFSRGEPGMETTFGSDEMLDDLGEAFYIPIGNSLRVFGHPAAKFVDTDIIKNDENLDVPEAAAWRIINMACGLVLKVAGFPVDVTDNNNPNVVSIKQKLADPQGL